MERRITAINKTGDSISILFNDGESSVFTKWGGTIYTQTSPGVLKKTLKNFKDDLRKFDFDLERLRALWVEDVKHGME